MERQNPTPFGALAGAAPRPGERPDFSSLLSAMDDVKKTIANAAQIQRSMLEVTGEAWSEDGLIKATVGPRGQLIDLEIDPRIYRRPNSSALSASIVATVRAAVDEVTARTQELLDQYMPTDIPTVQMPGMLSPRELMRSHDADLSARLEEMQDD